MPYRTEHTATLLKNGKVLIAGGWDANLVLISMMELFDPATRTFSSAGTMSSARLLHSATLLPNGKVLIVAGQVSGGSAGATTSVPSVQIYDPDAGTFSAAPDLARYQYEHVAVALSDGRVLIVGAYDNNRMQVFDPATGQFTTTGAMTKSRYNGQTATLLNDGRVLVAGGVINATPFYYDGSAEIYDPTTNSFTGAGSMATARAYHNASLLPDGRVLMSGGIEDNQAGIPIYDPAAEIFDPTTKTFVPGPSLPFAYERGTATTLLDNQVLIVGGGTSTGPQANCQLYDPVTGTFSITGSLAFARSFQTATLLPGGAVLIVGGNAKSGLPIVPAEVYQ